MTSPPKMLALASPSETAGMVLNAAHSVLRGSGGGHLTIVHAGAEANALTCDRMKRCLDDVALRGDIETQFVTRSGDPVEEVLRQAEQERCELIVTMESGLDTQRLIRYALCSILVLPLEARPTAEDAPILVPVGFQPESREALRFAARLARRGGQQLELLHVYRIEPGYHRLGRTREEHAALLERGARERIEALTARSALGDQKVAVSLQEHPHVAICVRETARSGRHSQIVMGAKRRSPAAGLVFPSSAERVVLRASCPVWIVREDASALGLPEAMWLR